VAGRGLLVQTNDTTAGFAIEAEATGSSGVAVIANGGLVGVSASASGSNASAFLGWANSTGPAAEFVNNGSGSTMSAMRGVVASRGLDGRAAVSAKNTQTSVVGTPSVALDLDGGISFRANRIGGSGNLDVPAGKTITAAMDNASIQIFNDQIVPSSVIILTMEQSGGPPAGAVYFISGIINGRATVQINGWGVTNHTLHYMIINPR
jgi:hypothetical protein